MSRVFSLVKSYVYIGFCNYSKPWLIWIRFDQQFYPVWAKIQISKYGCFWRDVI